MWNMEVKHTSLKAWVNLRLSGTAADTSVTLSRWQQGVTSCGWLGFVFGFSLGSSKAPLVTNSINGGWIRVKF